MDRRGFMKMMVGGLAAGAAVRTWPFRVYSFPAEIVAPTDAEIMAIVERYYYEAFGICSCYEA